MRKKIFTFIILVISTSILGVLAVIQPTTVDALSIAYGEHVVVQMTSSSISDILQRDLKHLITFVTILFLLTETTLFFGKRNVKDGEGMSIVARFRKIFLILIAIEFLFILTTFLLERYINLTAMVEWGQYFDVINIGRIIFFGVSILLVIIACASIFKMLKQLRKVKKDRVSIQNNQGKITD